MFLDHLYKLFVCLPSSSSRQREEPGYCGNGPRREISKFPIFRSFISPTNSLVHIARLYISYRCISIINAGSPRLKRVQDEFPYVTIFSSLNPRSQSPQMLTYERQIQSTCSLDASPKDSLLTPSSTIRFSNSFISNFSSFESIKSSL